MANECAFKMRAKGNCKDMNNVIQMITNLSGLYDINGKELYNDNNDFVCEFNGYCRWSVETSFMDDKNNNLKKISESTNSIIEVYSKEDEMCFEEHYVVDNGKIVINDYIEDVGYDGVKGFSKRFTYAKKPKKNKRVATK